MKDGTVRVKPAGSGSDVLLTVSEVAQLLRTTRSGIYQMVARGQLPGIIRIGRRLLFRRADLMDWIDHLAEKAR